MSTNLRFTQKFADSIVSTLECHDRVILKGYLPFGGDDHLNGWVDGALKLRRKDFLPLVEFWSGELVEALSAMMEGDCAGSMMTVRVEVAVRSALSGTTY